jgi:guanosine-3',5'-bis(diphosphate) 3'-pyrophosphohydrolase
LVLSSIPSLYVDAKLNAVSLNLRINKEKVAIVDIGFEINDIKQIEDLIKKMKKLDGVLEVYRNKK